MIIRVAGGNGAGKSYIAHRILEMYEHKTPIVDGTFCEKGGAMQNVFVPGHYRIANGGLDTIKSGPRLDALRGKMLMLAEAGWNVLYEVSSQKEGSAWLVYMKDRGFECHHLLLSTTDDERVDSVRWRGHHIREDLIRSSGRKAEKLTMEVSAGGVPILVLDRERALRRVVEWLS